MEKNNMRIAQVRPGRIPIPPNGWGAVERIIYDYKKYFERIGHSVDIVNVHDVLSNKDKYDIVHVHMADLALWLHNEGIPYIFSLHDHHMMMDDRLGVRNQNNEAVNNSILSIIPSNIMLSYIDNPDKVEILYHGVDRNIFSPKDRDISNGHSLLCVGNNGIIGNQTYDRKGFIHAIESANLLELPITVVGPRLNNESFFDKNSDLVTDNVNIIYDAGDDILLENYYKHTIFVHPSSYEAGQPNLTILEALSTGMPIVGICENNMLSAIKRCQRNTFSVVQGIQDVIKDYDSWKNKINMTIDSFSYEQVVKRLEDIYKNAISNKDAVVNVIDNFEEVNMKTLLISTYENTEIIHRSVNDGHKKYPKFDINYIDGATVTIQNPFDTEREFDVRFTDRNTNSVIYSTKIKHGHWAKISKKYFMPVHIYIDDELYTFSLNDKKVFIFLSSSSLGDSIAWFPYVEEFRKVHGCKVTVSTFWNKLFEKNYPDITFVNPGHNLNGYDASYSVGIWDGDFDKHTTHWKTIPLANIATDILGLPYKEIKANIVVDDTLGRPIKEKYVVLSEWSTYQAKLWLYPNAWQTVVDFLNSIGYKVAVISKEETKLKNIVNLTNREIGETINNIYHAEFSLSMASGLCWLAWALNKDTFVPSGFGESWAAYKNPYLIMNYDKCHGCFNDSTIKHQKNWYWCPRNKNFVCSTSITPDMVIEAIKNYLKK